jgi:hypothetical protein
MKWDGECLWMNETWKGMVSNIRHKIIEGIGKKMLSKSMRINLKCQNMPKIYHNMKARLWPIIFSF